MTLLKTWIDRHREPQCAPDEDFPYGKFSDLSQGAKQTCQTKLDCPTPRCGYWLVTCDRCGYNVIITTAGRPDDPNGVKLPCDLRPTRLVPLDIRATHDSNARLIQERFAPAVKQ